MPNDMGGHLSKNKEIAMSMVTFAHSCLFSFDRKVRPIE